MTITIDEEIRAFSDDAESSGEDEGVSTDSCFNNVRAYITSDNPENYKCFGNRFQIDIPKGATIVTAYWEGYIYTGILDDIACDIYGNLVSDALNFDSYMEGGRPYIWNVAWRPRTNASVEWVEDDLGVGWHNSPELKSIIQELVNQDDWQANNHMVLLFIGKVQEASKHAIFHSWNWGSREQEHTHTTKLHIEYTALPSKVIGLAVEAVSSHSFNLSWAANPIAEEVDLYRVYVKKGG